MDKIDKKNIDYDQIVEETTEEVTTRKTITSRSPRARSKKTGCRRKFWRTEICDFDVLNNRNCKSQYAEAPKPYWESRDENSKKQNIAGKKVGFEKQLIL